jgi:CHAT domain-containing protein
MQIELILEKIIIEADLEAAHIFLNRFGDYSQDNKTVGNYLISNNATIRLFGFLYYLILCAPGKNTLGAFELAPHLLLWIIEHPLLLEDIEQGSDSFLCSILYSYSQTAYQLNECSALESQLDFVDRTLPNLVKDDNYWGSTAYLAECYLRSFKFKEAEVLINSVPSHFHQNNRYSIATDKLEKFRTKRFEVELPSLTTEESLEIFEKMLQEQKQARNNYHDLSVNKESKSFQGMQSLFLILDEMRLILHGDKSKENKLKRLSKLQIKFHKASLIMTGSEPNNSYLQIQDLSHFSYDTEHLIKQKTVESLRIHLEKSEPLLVWCQEHQDYEGELMIMWHQILTHESLLKCHLTSSGLKEFVQSIKSLQNKLEQSQSEESALIFKAGIANYYPGVIQKAYKTLSDNKGIHIAIKAAEFNKERSLLALKNKSNIPLEIAINQTDSLGKNTHYLSLSTCNKTDQVFTWLYTSTGKIYAKKIALQASFVRKKYPNINPNDWGKSSNLFSRAEKNLDSLSPLLCSIESAFKIGQINKGDHICIAADDPMHSIPLHYLPIQRLGNKQLAVELFSFSRVQSFSDACSIYQSNKIVPTNAQGVYVPRYEEKEPNLKLSHFNNMAVLLESLSIDSNFMDMSFSSRATILSSLKNRSVIHFDTHGFFHDGQNPYQHAGLSISNGQSLPLGTGSQDFLMTPEQIVEHSGDLSHSHITLNACVSGLGKPGEGGDQLGLEFALRYRNAQSVIASHWNVNHHLSNQYLQHFYQYWLGERDTRGEAWRKATLDLIQDSGSENPEIIAQNCFFSLYGDWR